jgi:hypothetical protein
MLRYLAFLLVAIVLTAQTTKEQPVKPYEDPEAYAVYAALLSSPNSGKPDVEQAVMAQRTLVFENCYEPDEQWREMLSPVVENYKTINQQRWDLVDASIRFPHKLLSADEMHALFSKGPKPGWKKFHGKYPQKALLSVSAVGFNPDKTVAMVAAESDCDSLCGSGGMSFLRKVDGVWQKFQPTGTICIVNH